MDRLSFSGSSGSLSSAHSTGYLGSEEESPAKPRGNAIYFEAFLDNLLGSSFEGDLIPSNYSIYPHKPMSEALEGIYRSGLGNVEADSGEHPVGASDFFIVTVGKTQALALRVIDLRTVGYYTETLKKSPYGNGMAGFVEVKREDLPSEYRTSLGEDRVDGLLGGFQRFVFFVPKQTAVDYYKGEEDSVSAAAGYIPLKPTSLPVGAATQLCRGMMETGYYESPPREIKV